VAYCYFQPFQVNAGEQKKPLTPKGISGRCRKGQADRRFAAFCEMGGNAGQTGRKSLKATGLRAVVAGASAALLASGCDKGTFRETLPAYRYRLTAEVETPEGVRTGSSVIEVQWTVPGKASGTQGTASRKWRGEAAAVYLPKGETLFVLLSSPEAVDWAAEAPGRARILKESVSATDADRVARPVPRTIEFPWGKSDNYPYFVRFRDLRDPASVEQVDPDDLAKTFGEGTKLKSLTVQITDDPTTTGIGQRLPWALTHRGSLIKHGRLTPISEIPEVERLSEGAFIMRNVK
jgi:hypothetical protein